MNAHVFLIVFILFYATYYRNLKYSFMASVFKFQTDFCHDFVAHRFVLSRAHHNGIFASARESRVVW